MVNIALSEKLVEKLKTVEGKEIDEKILNLLETNVLTRLRECEERIFEFESRYGMDWQNFRKAWEEGAIKDKYSHKVERDFMEWEGFESERKKWFATLQDIRGI